MTTGRVEARIKIPTGGASVSASTGALASPVTVTVPAGNFYLTAAGVVDSILDELETGLNENVQGYPQTAAAMRAAVGYGTWSSGWLFNIASGNDSGAFGGVTMTAVSTPAYGVAGPQSGIDKAVSFDSSLDAFDAGNNFDPTDASDIAVFMVCGFPAGFSSLAGGTYKNIFTKDTAEFRCYYLNAALHFELNTGPSVSISVSTTTIDSSWFVVGTVIERATGKFRIGVCPLSGSAVVSSEGNAPTGLSNASSFLVGNSNTGSAGLLVAATYVAHGVSACTGMSANLSTAITSFRNSVVAAWSVSLGTDGRVTISNSGWPSSLEFTSSDLGTALGFADDEGFEYPDTPAAVTAALGGYGDFTTGVFSGAYLCNESSGDLSAAFGTPATLTAVSTPVYSSAGARGGDDKAISFDSTDDAFSGGDVHDVDASYDMLAAWVGRVPTAGNGDILGKWGGGGATPSWAVYAETTHFRLRCDTGGVGHTVDTTGLIAGEWHVGIAYVDRAAGRMGIAVKGLSSGTTTTNNAILPATTLANSANFRIGDQDLYGATANSPHIAYVAVTTGTSVAAGANTNIATIIASFAASMKSQTGTLQARGVWYPGSPLNCDDHPSMAPEETDARFSESPTGYTLGLSGNVKYVHTNVTWQRCQVSQIREAEATYDNGSLEVFFRDAITGLGAHPYFGPATPLQIWWNNAGTEVLLGADANAGAGVSGWCVVGVRKFADVARMSQRGWTGQFDVTFPRLVSEG